MTTSEQPPVRKLRPITVREAKLIKGVAEGKTRRDAALEAYNAKTPETASAMASEALKKPNVQEALAEAFRKHGIDIDSATKPIADGLKATRVVTDEHGKLVETELADHSIRLKASGLAFNLMGAGKSGEAGPSIHFHQHVEEKKTDYEF